MRISDWSSDVCSSDLRLTQRHRQPARRRDHAGVAIGEREPFFGVADHRADIDLARRPAQPHPAETAADAGDMALPHPIVLDQIGRAASRARVFQYVLISVVPVSLYKNKTNQKDATTQTAHESKQYKTD